MSCTVEKVLSDARLLVNRLKDQDGCADNVITQTQTLFRRMEAMKQYQEDLNELNEIARHRPRANLIMGLLQENNQIRELQQENRELRNSLEEHQSAIELIMSKYREQVARLMMANKMDQGAMRKSTESQLGGDQHIEEKIDKICEMAVVMQQAIKLDEEHIVDESRVITQLQLENQTLRELLKISHDSGSQDLSKVEQETQTMEDSSDVETTEDECNRSVIYRGPDLSHDTDTEHTDTDHTDTDHTDTDDGGNDTVIEVSPTCEKSPDSSASPVKCDTPPKKDSQVKSESLLKKDSPAKSNSPQKKDSPPGTGSTLKRDSPAKSSSPVRRDSPAKSSSPLRKDSPAKKSSPVKRDSPAKCDSPLKSDSPPKRDTPKKS